MSKKSKYIADKEIVSIESNIVKFTDGTEKYYNDAELVLFVSDTESNISEMREKRVQIVVKEFLETVERYNIPKGDIENVLSVFVQSYNKAFDTAMGKAFGTYEEGLHHSGYVGNIRISDIAKYNKL